MEMEDLLFLGVLVPLHHYLDVGGAPRAARLVRPGGNKTQGLRIIQNN